MSKAAKRIDLNRDIQKALDEIGRVDYAEVLRAHFPPRPIIPREYRRNHCVARRVQCLYVGPEDEVPTACPPGWDLVALFGVAFTRREYEGVTRLLAEAEPGERVLVGVPLRALPGTAQLKELAALDHLAESEFYAPGGEGHEALVVRRESVENSLRGRLRQSLRPGGFRWLHRGEVLEEAPPGTRGNFFTQVLMTLYPDCPQVPLTGSRRERSEAVDELLDLANPLQLPARTRRGGPRVLRRLLVEPGILQPLEDRGSYVRYAVAGRLPGDSPAGRAWNRLLDDVLAEESLNHRQPLGDVLHRMEQPPTGLRGPYRLFLLGALLRWQHPYLELYLDGESIPVSGVALRRALAAPRNWELVYHPAGEDELAFLRAVVERFGGQDIPEADPWERARAALLRWYGDLPAIVRSAPSLPSEDAARLADLLSDAERTGAARELLAAHLPALFGEERGIPIAENQEPLLHRLDAARRELEGYLSFYYEALTGELCGLFGVEAKPEEDRARRLDEGARRWLQGLHPGTESRAFSRWAAGLRDMLTEPGTFTERWFVQLPSHLELPPVRDWERDLRGIFLSRLSRARLELELWRIRELFPLPEDAEARRDWVRRWAREVVEEVLDLSPAQQESVLLDLLEETVWAPGELAGPAGTPGG